MPLRCCTRVARDGSSDHRRAARRSAPRSASSSSGISRAYTAITWAADHPNRFMSSCGGAPARMASVTANDPQLVEAQRRGERSRPRQPPRAAPGARWRPHACVSSGSAPRGGEHEGVGLWRREGVEVRPDRLSCPVLTVAPTGGCRKPADRPRPLERARHAARHVASSKWRPTIISPAGQPADQLRGHRDAGWPVTLNGAVLAIISSVGRCTPPEVAPSGDERASRCSGRVGITSTSWSATAPSS